MIVMTETHSQTRLLYTDRHAQVTTFEAIAASILIITGVLFAIQATAITPLTASTANERIEVQEQRIAASLLEAAADEDNLLPTVLAWDTSNQVFIGADDPNGFQNGGPPTDFGDQINSTFVNKSIGVNIDIRYRTPDNSRSSTQKLMYQGQPSDNAVSAYKTVVLTDDMELNDGSGRTLKSVEDRFYAKDASPSTNVYNIIEVRVVVWRM